MTMVQSSQVGREHDQLPLIETMDQVYLALNAQNSPIQLTVSRILLTNRYKIDIFNMKITFPSNKNKIFKEYMHSIQMKMVCCTKQLA